MTPEASSIKETLQYERSLWNAGYTRIAGVDEAGRGAWAGPVCAAAVILPPLPYLDRDLNGVRDSKLMSPREREAWTPVIRSLALGWGVGFASPFEIDSFGILPATHLAAKRALEALAPDYLLTDYLLFRDLELDQTALIKGDQHSLSISAASVLAKTTRDSYMVLLDTQLPGYDFAHHKGYGTLGHRESITRQGLCPEHRKSFKINR